MSPNMNKHLTRINNFSSKPLNLFKGYYNSSNNNPALGRSKIQIIYTLIMSVIWYGLLE